MRFSCDVFYAVSVMLLLFLSYLLPDKSRSGKKKTKTIFRDLNPIWEEMMVYKGVTLEALRHRVLEVRTK